MDGADTTRVPTGLEGSLAVVTGGASGLGEVLCRALAAAGAPVVVADRDGAAAAAVAADLVGAGQEAWAWAGDVTTDAERLVREAGGHGDPRILVNNAGGWTPGRQYPHTTDWPATIDLNLVAPMRLTRLVADLGPGRAVVNIASSAGVGDAAYASPEYAAAKAGLVRFTAAAAGMEETHGVRVTCVVPDWIGLRRAYEELAAMSPERRAAAPPLVPPEDVAAVVLDLVVRGRGGTVVELWGGEVPHIRPARQH
jgi:3-oxoacyl-[acyl-carrier protein] reductase